MYKIFAKSYIFYAFPIRMYLYEWPTPNPAPKPTQHGHGRILKIICRELEIFHTLLKIQHLVDPDKCFAVMFVNTTAFFFREGVWRHSIFVPRWNIKERNTHVSRKSCIIQPIRRRLRHYWSVSR